jgi:hypothetical protein
MGRCLLGDFRRRLATGDWEGDNYYSQLTESEPNEASWDDSECWVAVNGRRMLRRCWFVVALWNVDVTACRGNHDKTLGGLLRNGPRSVLLCSALFCSGLLWFALLCSLNSNPRYRAIPLVSLPMSSLDKCRKEECARTDEDNGGGGGWVKQSFAGRAAIKRGTWWPFLAGVRFPDGGGRGVVLTRLMTRIERLRN